VNQPGPKEFQENTDILDVLALAGGPSATADLKNTRLITKDGFYAQTLKVNLEKYAKEGRPARYIVRKEDTFVVPAKGQGFLGVGLGTIAGVAGTITTVILLINRLNSNSTTTR
jgi:protein involved in polysaccharide export with SLBB domain